MALSFSRPFLLLLSFLSVLAVLYSVSLASASTSSSSVHEAFLQCLLNHSHPQHPISAVIYTPKNSNFSSVLQAYIRNLRFNTSATQKPFLILTALHDSHVQSAVICAQSRGLQMKIRSGGHDFEGISYFSDVPFFILDMFNLRSVDIDVENETSWVGAGALLGEVYYKIQEKSRTLGFPAGVCPTVGVGGHLSGGGYGNMMRKYGLTVDHVVDAKLVDVKGRVLDRASMGEDLFWAIRGGGGASFGVILSYKINLVRIPETVTVFQVRKTLEENATDLVYKWQHVAPYIHEDLFIRLVFDVVNGTQAGEKMVRASFLSFFLGDSKRLLSIMNESFPELGLQQSDCIETGWLQSVLFWATIAIDTPVEILLKRRPQIVSFVKRKSDYVTEPIPKEGLEFIWQRLIEVDPTILTFNPYGGRMWEVPVTATPFPHRAGNLWKVQYAVNWNQEGAEATEQHIDSLRKIYGHMTPYVSKNPRSAFFNYKDLDLGINHNGKRSYLEGMAYGVKYFKGNFDRLVKIKTKVDPGNFFRNEQSIPILPYGRR